MGDIYGFEITRVDERCRHFHFFINPGDSIIFNPVKIDGKHIIRTSETILSLLGKIIHMGMSAKEDLLSFVYSHKRKVAAAAGIIIASAAIGISTPLYSAEGMSINGTPVTAAIFNSSGDSEKYKDTIAAKALRDAVAESVKIHDQVISQSATGRSAKAKADSIKIVLLVDGGKDDKGASRKIETFIDSTTIKRIAGKQMDGGKDMFSAFSVGDTRAGAPLSNNKVVFVRVPSIMVESGMQSSREAAALKAIVETTLIHELTHAEYGHAEKEAVAVQCKYGKALDPTTQTAAIIAVDNAVISKAFSELTSRMFSHSSVVSSIDKIFANQSDKEVARQIASTLSLEFKKRADCTSLLGSGDVEYYSAWVSNKRILQQEEHGYTPQEYAGAAFGEVDFNESVDHGTDIDGLLGGYLKTSVEILKTHGFSDRTILKYLDAFVDSGEAYRFVHTVARIKSSESPETQTVNAGLKAAVDDSIKDMARAALQKEVAKKSVLLKNIEAEIGKNTAAVGIFNNRNSASEFVGNIKR